MIGDSYAVGLGASTPEKSFTGLFAKDFPSMDITNLSKSGISTRGLLKYLLKKEEFNKYDRAIVVVGGMDIINHTPLTRLELSLTALISLLEHHCKEIILVIPGHVGLIPLYNWPLSAILNQRARKVRKLFKHVAGEYGVKFLEEHTDLLIRDREKYYAQDQHHPNDQGYELMYTHMREAIEKLGNTETY
jgi:lysophospholipase L1-like esterase